MSKSLNQVIVLGNLTRVPEIKQLASGNSVASFSLALNRADKDSDGEWQEATDYVDVSAWGVLAQQIHENLDKGSRVLVNGRLTSRSWDDKDTGAKRSKVEVLATDVTFLDKTHIEVTHED